MKEIKRIEIIESGPPPFCTYYDDLSTEGINPTAAAEQISGGMVKLGGNIDRDGLSAVCGPGFWTRPEYKILAVDMIANARSAVIAHKKAQGGHIEQANGGYSKVSEIYKTGKSELTELLSASTKFFCRIKEGVSWIFSKNVFVSVLLFSNPPMVSAVDTYNSTAVVSPPSLQPLNMAHQLAPPPPPPMRVTRRGFLPLGPPSPSEMKKRSNLTESKKEWGLSPKRSPPSCLPDC